MSRIIAGQAGGRRLTMPPGRSTRPTVDRVREAMFASLTADFGSFAGLAFLDLYAGSGAVGLEALSRGASPVLLVESDRRAVQTIRANVRTVGMPGVSVRQSTVAKFVESPADTQYDVVFLDPPYVATNKMVGGVLSGLATGGWLAPDVVIVVERSTRAEPFEWPEGTQAERSRRYGETTLWYGRGSGERSTW